MTTAEMQAFKEQYKKQYGTDPTYNIISAETQRRAGVKPTPKTTTAPKVAGIGQQITSFVGGAKKDTPPVWMKKTGTAIRKGTEEALQTAGLVTGIGWPGSEAEAATPKKPIFPTPTGEPPQKTIPKTSSGGGEPKVAGIEKILPQMSYNVPSASIEEQPSSSLLNMSAATPPSPEPSPWERAKGIPSAAWEGTKGIASGIGTWASDPKIARALMTAGLSTLAAEPRRVPYSNAEMLGRAGLAGIGAFDQAAAGEAAGRETARKAGIEGRITTATEGKAWADMSEKFTNVDAWRKDPNTPLISRETGKARKVMKGDAYIKNGKWYTPYIFEDTGEIASEFPTTEEGAIGRRAAGADKESTKDLALKSGEAAYQESIKAFPGEYKKAEEARAMAIQSYRAEAPGSGLQYVPGQEGEGGGWFGGGKESTQGRYVQTSVSPPKGFNEKVVNSNGVTAYRNKAGQIWYPE